MRKELPNTYTPLERGGIGIRARTPDGQVVEHEIVPGDLTLDVVYTDKQGTPNNGKVVLRPVTAEVLRVDQILPSDLSLMYLGALNCYSDLETPDLVANARSASQDEMGQFLQNNIISTGHWSVVEHRGPSFLIGGVSRAFSHQLVRHRLLSFSQQSQRYLDFGDTKKMRGQEAVIPFIIPPSIRYKPEFVETFLKGVKNVVGGYFSLRAGGAFPEDARFLLPNAAATRLIVSGNRRVWLELIPKRTCARAQWEIDMVITEVARKLWEEIPAIFERVGPACSSNKCDQGKRSCGVTLNQPLSEFFEDSVYPHDHLIFGMR